MWISYSPDLRHWGDHTLLIEARQGAWWDADKIGLGPPPLATPDGWLVMYHGAHVTASGPIYRVGLALLDLERPEVVLHRSDNWVLGPHADYERVGDVNKVVFPNGWVVDHETDSLSLYYGAAIRSWRSPPPASQKFSITCATHPCHSIAATPTRPSRAVGVPGASRGPSRPVAPSPVGSACVVGSLSEQFEGS